MQTWLFHDLTIGQVGDVDLLGRVFHQYPSCDRSTADLIFDVRMGTAAPPLEIHEPHGLAHADGRYVVTDGHTSFEISPDGRSVQVSLPPDDRPDVHLARHRTLIICLMMALRHHRMFLLHGAGVVDPKGRTVLIVGHSGAGKSTTAIALLEAGCRFLADDTLVLRGSNPPSICGLLKDFHVGEATLAGFPRLIPFLEPPCRDPSSKRAFDPHRVWPGARVDCARAPELVLFPRVCRGRPVDRRPLSKAEAFARVVESSASFAADGAAERMLHLDVIRTMVNHARCLELDVGDDLFANPRRLLGIVDTL